MSDIAVNCKVDTGFFEQMWARYIKVMSRTLPQAVNDKLFMLARKALWFTQKAEAKDISRTLGKISYLHSRGGERKYRHRLTKAAQQDAPLIALIINKRQGASGEKGLYGAMMRQRVQQVIMARMQSIAYIKSGWLPAIQSLAQVSSIKTNSDVRDDRAARQVGKPKGRFTIAKAGDIIQGMIANDAYSTRDQKQAFERVGGKGLDTAFASEGKDMQDYIEKKTKAATDAFNDSQR